MKGYREPGTGGDRQRGWREVEERKEERKPTGREEGKEVIYGYRAPPIGILQIVLKRTQLF